MPTTTATHTRGMQAALEAYYSLTPAQRTAKSDAVPVLTALLSTLSLPAHPELTPEPKRKLLSTLLSTLSPLSPGALSSSSDPSVLLPTLSLVKLLGRATAGSEELAREAGLRTLLDFGGLARAAAFEAVLSTDDDDEGGDEDGLRAVVEEDEEDKLLPHESEALKCLCNTLMLHPSARDVLRTLVQEDRDRLWIKGLVRILGMKGAGFLSGRILFFITAAPAAINQELVEDTQVLNELEKYIKRYLRVLRSPNSFRLNAGPTPTSSDILREHLKMAYSLMLQYSRIPTSSLKPPTLQDASEEVEEDGASTHSAAETGTAPSSRAATPQPGDAPPRETESGPNKLRKKIFGDNNNSNGKSSTKETSTSESTKSTSSSNPLNLAKKLVDAVSGSTSSRRTSVSKSSKPRVAATIPNAQNSIDGGELTLFASQRFLPLFSPYLQLSVLLPFGSDLKSPNPLLLNALNVLLNFPIQLEELDGVYHSWLQPVEGSEVLPELKERGFAPLPAKALELFGRSCEVWFPVTIVPKGVTGPAPVHPDELIPKGQGESSRIEEILGPLMLLLRKLSILAETAEQMKGLLLPENLDRSTALEKRTDLLGHLIRLLSSILLPNTAYGVGELLYNLCDRDPATLSLQIGYGNACGFLQNRGELIPPPSNPPPSSDRRNSATSSATTSTPATLIPSSSSSKGREKENTSSTSTSKPHSSSTKPKDPSAPSIRLASTTTASNPSSAPARVINPITGSYEVPPSPGEIEMTPEEKEREAERLYVLFDRLEKSGVVEVNNPVKAAKEAGKMESSREERERERREREMEDEEDEKAVEEELRAYKERKKGRKVD